MFPDVKTNCDDCWIVLGFLIKLHSICLESEIGECKLQLQIVFPICHSISNKVEDWEGDEGDETVVPYFSYWIVDVDYADMDDNPDDSFIFVQYQYIVSCDVV